MSSWFRTFAFLLSPLILAATTSQGFDVLDNFSGLTFFEGWDFYGSWDNLTLGDVWWLNQTQAVAQNLVSMNDVGNTIIRVDNASTVLYNDKRDSIRITTQRAYGVGTVWIADLVHLPFGCSVWPALWTMGTQWPLNGEIDIVEGINLMTQNQMALHTLPGCIQAPAPNQLGTSGELNCSMPSGCTVLENKPGSFGANFSADGGGVYAAQFDVAGIFIWFWPRATIPQSIQNATMSSPITLDDWGSPSASYLSTDACNITQSFGPQKLVVDITLCGVWAGLPSLYLPQCANSGPTGICYNDNVVGPGSRYDDAYFEISYIRAYTTGVAAGPTATGTSSAGPTGSALPLAGSSKNDAAAPGRAVARCMDVAMILGVIFVLCFSF